jgi:hypothetical protein
MTELFSNHPVAGLTPEGLRKLATVGPAREAEPSGPFFRVHALSRRLSRDVIDEIVRRYQSGESATSLAKELGVAPSALLNLMRERNITVRKHGVSKELAARLATEYAAGSTVAELEAKHGLSHGAVMRALKSAGAVMRPTGRRPR